MRNHFRRFIEYFEDFRQIFKIFWPKISKHSEHFQKFSKRFLKISEDFLKIWEHFFDSSKGFSKTSIQRLSKTFWHFSKISKDFRPEYFLKLRNFAKYFLIPGSYPHNISYLFRIFTL